MDVEAHQDVGGDAAIDVDGLPDPDRGKDAGDCGGGEQDPLDGVYTLVVGGQLGQFAEVPDVLVAEVEVGCANGEHLAGAGFGGDAADEVGIDGGAEVGLETVGVHEGGVGGEEVERAAGLDPVGLGVAVEVFGPEVGFLGADEGEGCEEGAGAHAADEVELRAAPLGVLDGTPSDEEAGAERAVLAAAGHGEHVDRGAAGAGLFEAGDDLVHVEVDGFVGFDFLVGDELLQFGLGAFAAGAGGAAEAEGGREERSEEGGRWGAAGGAGFAWHVASGGGGAARAAVLWAGRRERRRGEAGNSWGRGLDE